MVLSQRDCKVIAASFQSFSLPAAAHETVRAFFFEQK